MSHVSFGNNQLKVEGYKNFWSREDVKRPLVGFSFKSWFPLEEYRASSAWQAFDFLTPEMVEPRAFMDDQERLLREGEIIDDDIFRGACPCQAVPWLCGMLGSTLRILPGNILAKEKTISWDELDHIHLDQNNTWFRKYIEFTESLVKRSGSRFPVSHATLLAPSDLAGMLRGHAQSIIDLIEEPEKASKFLWKLSEIFRQITEKVWEHIPLFQGGYFDAQYQLWSPGPIIRMQEDATALYSPELYRKFLQPVDRELARHFSCSFIHLHSTSMFILDAFLEIEENRCFEVNNDIGGPPIREMVPYFQMIQNAKRSLLIRGSFTPDELCLLIDYLEPRGLYLYIMVKDIEEVYALRLLLGM